MTSSLFLVLPYIALVLAILGGLYRYYTNRFSYSSLSSQLLESRLLRWGSVPWHYGIIPILLAHLLAGLFPRAWDALLGVGLRLFVFEAIGWGLAAFALVGILVLIVRRLPRRWPTHVTTSGMDGLLLGLLLMQVTTGLATALFTRWGGRWYLSTAVPWFWSIVRLQPDASTVLPLPAAIQFHMLNGFLIILLFPFSRLVHVFTVPITYFWRPYQVVIWNRRNRTVAGS